MADKMEVVRVEMSVADWVIWRVDMMVVSRAETMVVKTATLKVVKMAA